MTENYGSLITEKFDEIERLIRTPELVRQHSIHTLEGLEPHLNNTGEKALGNALQILNNIAESSFSENYQIIYNQLCVLSVSILSALLRDYFIGYATTNWKSINQEVDNIKFTFRDLIASEEPLHERIGELILEKDNGIKFEDMQSTLRTFNKYFQKEAQLEESIVCGVIFYQQCRHEIVHNNGRVSQMFLDRVEKRGCNLKGYTLDSEIRLDENDWGKIRESFGKFVEQFMLSD